MKTMIYIIYIKLIIVTIMHMYQFRCDRLNFFQFLKHDLKCAPNNQNNAMTLQHALDRDCELWRRCQPSLCQVGQCCKGVVQLALLQAPGCQ